MLFIAITPSRQAVKWEPHTDNGNCKTCALAQKIKRGGKPAKKNRSRGRGLPKSASSSANEKQVEPQVTLLSKLDELVANGQSMRNGSFTKTFEPKEAAIKDLFCSVCKELFNKPIET